MEKTPKALRLHIGVFGRTNVGKSSFLNMVSGQDVSITSNMPGTTTDVVEKTMELLPLGPVVFLDTAGIDDTSQLSDKRIEKTNKIFNRADIVCLITEPDIWGDFEEGILNKCCDGNIPVIVVINKVDIKSPDEAFIERISEKVGNIICLSSVLKENRDEYIAELKSQLIHLCPDDFLNPPPLIGDLIAAGETVVLIVPIDLQAPKGRLILPQVQTIRDALDSDSMALVVKEREYKHALYILKKLPALAVCDSQVVMKMVADTPSEMKCTTFSILFSRYKGDLIECVKGVKAIDKLGPEDKILIAESCSHHAIEDDIGRVKIPRWLRQYLGHDIKIDIYSGKDYPDNLSEYGLIVHCGGCMTNRREMLYRINLAKKHGVPITNYGVCISFLQGVLERVLSPFPAALDAFKA
ncbi:MAG: [FeFe] hydrogenase H-cluster maturation GTPase HydF [Candidatus Omnitrophica bacterium]|nr:[FeFe] hydrogenase H-cluster maturation GTPase HydF [Candidatus Omnitrophota bacterium]MDD5081174.1 [FeFe] hydrogenase H-cluster maturation GTPase HydF [Candidatus Omnitrophota bacterium]MDD5441045.1 [FeFe] hydrogenase H-cluster maturation GTPase HydF [Candidatus Omnitrophota bacterium]